MLKNDIFCPESLAWHVMGTEPPAKIPRPKLVTPPPVLKFFNPPTPQTFYSPPVQLEMAASAFFTHGYF